MRKTILSLMVVSVAAIGAMAPSASAATPVTCEASATVKLSPGLGNSPQVQNVTVKGTLKNCAGEGSTVTGGTFIGHLKTGEVTCASLLSLGEADSGTIVIKWAPKGQGNSLGSFAMPLTEQPVALGGLVEQGPFAEAAISGSVTQSYTGGTTCGVAEGKKKAKKVNKGTLAGSLTV